MVFSHTDRAVLDASLPWRSTGAPQRTAAAAQPSQPGAAGQRALHPRPARGGRRRAQMPGPPRLSRPTALARPPGASPRHPCPGVMFAGLHLSELRTFISSPSQHNMHRGTVLLRIVAPHRTIPAGPKVLAQGSVSLFCVFSSAKSTKHAQGHGAPDSAGAPPRRPCRLACCLKAMFLFHALPSVKSAQHARGSWRVCA